MLVYLELQIREQNADRLRDATLVQSAVVGTAKPVIITGKWGFDSQESRATFYGAMIVTIASTVPHPTTI